MATWHAMDGVMDGQNTSSVTDSKVYGANMGPIWGRQDPGGPRVGPMNFDIWGQAPGGPHVGPMNFAIWGDFVN